MGRKTISLTVPAKLLARIEEAAEAHYCTRSDYIRGAVVERLNQQQVTAEPPKSKAQPLITQQSEDEFLKELERQYTQKENC